MFLLLETDPTHVSNVPLLPYSQLGGIELHVEHLTHGVGRLAGILEDVPDPARLFISSNKVT